MSAFISDSLTWKSFDGKDYTFYSEEAVFRKFKKHCVLDQVPELAVKHQRENEISKESNKLRNKDASPANIQLVENVNIPEDSRCDSQVASKYPDAKTTKRWPVVENIEEQLQEESTICVKVEKDDDLRECFVTEDIKSEKGAANLPSGAINKSTNKDKNKIPKPVSCLKIKLFKGKRKKTTPCLSLRNDRNLSIKSETLDLRGQNDLPVVVVKRMSMQLPFEVARSERRADLVCKKLKPRQCNSFPTLRPSNPNSPHKSPLLEVDDDRSRHLKTRLHFCTQCVKSFSTKTHFRRHFDAVHKKLKPHSCDLCGKKFSTRSNLTKHVKIVHKKLKTNASTQPGSSANHRASNVHEKIQRDAGDVKKETFSRPDKVNAHANPVHKHSENKCDLCHGTFSNRANLNRHMDAVHRKLKPYTCRLCERAFFARANLNKHVDAVHKQLKPFACHLCERAFSARADLSKHVIAVHKSQKPNSCDVCKRDFSSRVTLNSHVNAIHKKQKPYSCNVCKISFSWRSALFGHMKAVHKRVKQNALRAASLVCIKCSESFANDLELRNHMSKVHSLNNMCAACGRNLKSRALLKRHVREVHERLRPFICTQCDRTFPRKSHLINHTNNVH